MDCRRGFFFFLKQCVGAEEKLTEVLQESIVIKMLPSTLLFLREALDAFALIPGLVKIKKIKKCQHTYKLRRCSQPPSPTSLMCKSETEEMVKITSDLMPL